MMANWVAMELRAFAEQILFATTLEEKLRAPRIITDEQPGTAVIVPAAPGRPDHLRFRTQGARKADFPGLHGINDSRERGRLLHFFANHELLATELMALVLLRFPEAPAAFRKGVLQTLKDEQEHTRWYLQRMKACGIEFGELPVSGYFWRCVSPMENPIDYVAGLCLTFEQANLDFARHFAGAFNAAGDTETAALLDRIYHDEIGHVAYGLKWFRRWKNPTDTDWTAFCRALKFPLSPQRAKGFTVNVEGRQAAGFDSHFIAELEVFSQSRGRTPNVFVFNPFVENRLAEGAAFNLSEHQKQFVRDLENLPQFLCRQDDIVLVERRPSVEFLSTIKRAGFALPEFVALPGHDCATRKLGRLRPWAWGPDSIELFRPFFPNVTAEHRTPELRFNERLAEIYSKSWSASFLKRFLRQVHDTRDIRPPTIHQPPSTTSWLCSEDEAGATVESLDAALAAVAAVRARGHHRVVVKQSLGLAGANAVRLFEPEVLETQRRWMANALRNGRHLVVEPWLERALDFSVQLEMSEFGLALRGFTGLLNDHRGQFQANWAEPHHHTRPPAGIAALFPDISDITRRILNVYREIFAALETELRAAHYAGPIGIDAFVYRTPNGCRLKPIVEINPRYTMGRLTVELMKQTRPGSCGAFRLINRAMLRKEGTSDFAAYARSWSARYPVELEGEPVPQIRRGAVVLNDPEQARICLATFQVGRSLEEIGISRETSPSSP
jgi:uncharacterized ferritin-like protein (DUF455 family)